MALLDFRLLDIELISLRLVSIGINVPPWRTGKPLYFQGCLPVILLEET